MVSYYNKISASYNELYREEQQEKINIIMQHITIKPEYKLLDIGCGTAFYLDDFNCECIGIDPSQKLLEQYKGKKRVLEMSAEALSFKDNEFDIVTSFTALQNFSNIEKGLKEIKRVGKNVFALSFLKRGESADKIKELILNIFSDFNIKELEHHKDIIMIIVVG